MYFAYSILLSLAFVLMLPLFLLRREKYASGFSQRLGNYSPFEHDDRQVIWLHCVSVGETNAARPLVDKLLESFPNHRLVISTTTKTGQELAQKIFAEKADAIVYFPFDWKFSVRRALKTFRPSLVLLMETEIWPRFIHEAKISGAKVAIVNGRLSQKSFERYSMFRSFITRVLRDVDLVLMQGEADAKRVGDLGIDERKIGVTGNLKFEQPEAHDDLTGELQSRFVLSSDKLLVIAASTHDPEERQLIQSLHGMLGSSCRLIIAPRHPERFATVANLLHGSDYNFVRRSDAPSSADRDADIILLDSIGELRSVYPFGDIVFVGGSLIPHGGQSILEPAAEGKAIVTGPHTANFDAVVKEFLHADAVRQVADVDQLGTELAMLLRNDDRRKLLGANAAGVMNRNRNATAKTLVALRQLLEDEKSAA